MNPIRRITSKLAHSYFQLKSGKGQKQGVVLMLHHIGEATNKFNISVSEFDLLLKLLIRNNVIRLEKWETSKNFIALTIDDVPESFYFNAYPFLKKYEIPFTIFVNTSLLDTKGFITTAQLKEMASCELCTVGSHGVSHSEFTKMTKREALNDLSTSQKILSDIINKPVEMFAFPFGSYYACGYINKHLVSEVYKYGFGTLKTAITNPLSYNKYYLPRVNVDAEFIDSINTKE